MIILSCGHKVIDMQHDYAIIVKTTSQDGEKAIGYMTVCGSCKEWFRHSNDILDNEEQAQEWLKKEQW